VLVSVVGDSAAEELVEQARQDLRQRVGLLLEEELLRFGQIVDEAGPVDPVAAVRLYQAEYSLEAAR
jgi:ribosomal protein S13